MTYEYLAGLMDGEGCVGIRRVQTKATYGRPCYCLVIQLAMTYQPVIEILCEEFGGVIYIDHWYVHLKHKPSYKWTVYGRKAAAILAKMLPTLIVKREQAELALRFQANMHEKFNGYPVKLTDAEMAFRQECYEQMRRLNKRGL